MKVLRRLSAPASRAYLDEEQGRPGLPGLLAPLHPPHLPHPRHRQLQGGPHQPPLHHRRGPALDEGLLPLDHQPVLLVTALCPRLPLRHHLQPPHGQCERDQAHW